MNHRENKKHANSSQIPIKQEHHPNGQGVPIKHRSCLKHQSKPMNEETGRLSTGRVSFAHASSNEGKIQLPSQSQLDLGEKKHRSAMFAKKAKELRLAELNYFKDHARDKEPNDE